MKKVYHLTEDNKDLFQGKTIAQVRSDSINHWEFVFTDGTTAHLWSETFHVAGAGDLPKMFVMERTCGYVELTTFAP